MGLEEYERGKYGDGQQSNENGQEKYDGFVDVDMVKVLRNKSMMELLEYGARHCRVCREVKEYMEGEGRVRAKKNWYER